VSKANAPFGFVQEVQVKSGGFEAEYGGALGGVVNVAQKRGSNAWHGSVFSYYSGEGRNMRFKIKFMF
jgi:outer membrane receptor for ferrienterochelin and colicin